jgi:cobalt/nickel transport system ATP-binding protein
MSQPLFAVDCVTYRYGRVPALCDLSMSIDPGERIALLGANGSGKSTLLRVLDGLYFPESGSVRFCGEVLSEERFASDEFAFGFRRRVGLVFQNPDAQLFCPTVFEEVAFGPLQLRWPAAELRARVGEMLDMLQISHLRNRPPHHLSGGEKKKVALASVLVLDPEVVLLDEPTSALDPRSQLQIVDILTGWGRSGKTLITATHDLHVLEDIADGCRILEQGRIVASGSPAEILQDEELLTRSNLVHSHRRPPHSHLHPGHRH